MRVRALYVPPGKDAATGEPLAPIPCYVRVHTKFVQLGDQKGTNLNSAETDEKAPRLLFWREEVPKPLQTGYVTITAADSGHGKPEGYRIGSVLPTEGQTVSVRVYEMSESQLAGLLFREDG